MNVWTMLSVALKLAEIFEARRARTELPAVLAE
jgi:hypothetical protein